MTARSTTTHLIDEAAALLRITPAALAAAVEESARLAAQPSANHCTLPGQVLQVPLEFHGTYVVARRDSESPDAVWHFELIG